jgi:glycosyltransferase involved in cell wall biosynthesis
MASVQGQSYRNWELIIIDDGSVDDTARIVMPIMRSDPRIVYCYQANRGLARARNLGIALATGTYTTFLDSDDELRPEHLSVRVKALEKAPSLALGRCAILS